MWQTGTATDHLDLLAKLNTFITSQGSAFYLVYAGTGNGTFDSYTGGSASVAETFTITATSATNFTVTGSVSGSLSAATVGVAYTSTKINFTITAGGTAFVSGDTFTINTAPKYTSLYADGFGVHSYGFKAFGIDGLKSIFFRIYAPSNNTTYWNWRVGAYLTLDSAGNYTGWSDDVTLLLWNQTITYWFFCNGQRTIAVAKVGAVYYSMYIGFGLPIDSGLKYTYPVYVGGSGIQAELQPYSNTSSYNTFFVDPQDSSGGCRACYVDYTWQLVNNGNGSASGKVYPYYTAQTTTSGNNLIGKNADGSYPLENVVIHMMPGATPTAHLMYLDGVFHTSGESNTSENIITVSPNEKYICFQNVFRTGMKDFMAVRLD